MIGTVAISPKYRFLPKFGINLLKKIFFQSTRVKATPKNVRKSVPVILSTNTYSKARGASKKLAKVCAKPKIPKLESVNR